MFLIDVTHPAGALDRAEQAAMAERITKRMMLPGAAPLETMARARRMLHIAFHEAATWCTGDGPWTEADPPPLVVTVTVPEAWREEFSSHGISAVRDALAAFDRDRGLVRAGGDVWVNVVGVADGSIGLNGTATDATSVVNYMTEEYRATGGEAADLPEGMVLDPVCGMRVRLGPGAITLVDDGTTVGFCSTGCRTAYAQEHHLAVPS